MPKQRELHIDGLKGIACIGIFLYHFNVAFIFLQPDILRNIVEYTPIKVFMDRGMVNVFCILSGYVICRSKISTIKELVKKIVQRYFRLVLPIFAAYLCVYLFGFIWGFPSTRISEYVTDYGLYNYYQNPLDLKTLFYEPFIKIWFSTSSLITPLWMIRYILYGSIVIYAYNYLISKFPEKEKMIFAIFMIVLAIVDFTTWLTLCVFLGMALYKLNTNIKVDNHWIYWLLFAGSVLLMWFAHEAIYEMLNGFVRLPGALNLNGHWRAIYGFALVFSIGKLDALKKVFSNKIVLKLSSISFPLYLLHFPLICSFTMTVFFHFINSFTVNIWYYLILLFVTIVLLVIVSYLFSNYVEKYINKIMKKVFQK